MKIIKKGFPYKTIFGNPKGWENLGMMNPKYNKKTKSEETLKHSMCGDVVNVGKENNVLFYFCERCLKKIKKINK